MTKETTDSAGSIVASPRTTLDVISGNPNMDYPNKGLPETSIEMPITGSGQHLVATSIGAGEKPHARVATSPTCGLICIDFDEIVGSDAAAVTKNSVPLDQQQTTSLATPSLATPLVGYSVQRRPRPITANYVRTGAPTLIVNSSARVRIDIDTPTKADAADSIVPFAAIVEDSRNACRSRTLRGDGNHCGTLPRPPTHSVDGEVPVEPTTLGICPNFSNNLIDGGPEEWNRSRDGMLDDDNDASSGAVGERTRPCGRIAPGATIGAEQQLKQNRNGNVVMLFPVLETKGQDNGKGGAATGTGADHGSDGLTAPTAPTATTAIVRKEQHELHNERIVSLPTKNGRMDRGCNQSFVNKMAMNRTNSASKRKIECAASGMALNIAGPRYGNVARVGAAGAAAGLDRSMNDEIEGKT